MCLASKVTKASFNLCELRVVSSLHHTEKFQKAKRWWLGSRLLDTKVFFQVQKKAKIENLLNRILGGNPPLHGCYVQGFLPENKVPVYKTLDIN